MPKKEQTETQPAPESTSVPTFDIAKHTQTLTIEELTKAFGGAHKVTLPPFVKPGEVPVGSVIIGKIETIISDFTGREGMEDAQNLILILPSGDKITFPLTGTLLQSMLRVPAPQAGKMIAIKRLPDSTDAKFKNKMFMWDLIVLGMKPGELTMGNGEVKRRVKKVR